MYLILVDRHSVNATDFEEMVGEVSGATDIVNCISAETLFRVAENVAPEVIIVDFALIKSDRKSFFRFLHDKSPFSYIFALIDPENYEELISIVKYGLIDDYVVKPIYSEDFKNRLKIAVSVTSRVRKEGFSVSGLQKDSAPEAFTAKRGRQVYPENIASELPVAKAAAPDTEFSAESLSRFEVFVEPRPEDLFLSEDSGDVIAVQKKSPFKEASPDGPALEATRKLAKKDRPVNINAKRYKQFFSNVLFGLLLLLIAALSFFLIQSKIAGGPTRIAGNQIYIVYSGSMSPAFDTGSIIFVRDMEPEELVTGDVITFHSQSGTESLTTHRIVEVVNDTGLKFITRGDANNVNDPQPVLAENIVGIVTASAPYIGYLLHYVQTRLVLILLLFAAGLLALVYGMATIFSRFPRGKHEKIN